MTPGECSSPRTTWKSRHYLEEADALGDRIAIIDHGELVAEGTPDELKRGIAGDVVLAFLLLGLIAGSGSSR